MVKADEVHPLASVINEYPCENNFKGKNSDESCDKSCLNGTYRLDV